jgi:hypothetical protein
MTPEAEQYLISISNLSIRVLVNYLEKIYIVKDRTVDEQVDGLIGLDLCKKICSNISYQQFEHYIEKVKENKLSEAIDILYKIHDYGYSVIDILDYFFAFIKTTTILDEETKYRYIPFICKYITIFHNVHEDGIELALFTNNLGGTCGSPPLRYTPPFTWRVIFYYTFFHFKRLVLIINNLEFL